MRWAVVALSLAWGAEAAATTHRIAVLVGNNAGSGERPPLHFAESDAGKMARVLADLARVPASDLFLLQAQPLSAIQDAMQSAHKRVEGWHQNPADRVLLVFYFSGHSDGEALEIGSERLSYADLRSWLAKTGADVQLAIVDSCRSGALIAAKGAKPAEGFDIEIQDDLDSAGQVFLASSAADESALESTALGGSFFTHYLVSALRGAADRTHQGRVTLGEAYRYAYENTLASASQTSYGAQHPIYDYRLSGRGELVLTELSESSATLELPSGFDRALVYETRRDQVMAELTPGSSRRLALAPGIYAVWLEREGSLRGGRFALAAGDRRVVSWSELPVVLWDGAQSKGTAGMIEATQHAPTTGFTIAVGGGPTVGVAESLGLMGSARLEASLHPFRGPYLALSMQTGATSAFRESAGLLLVGYRFGLQLHRFELFAAPAIGGGGIVQAPGGSTALGALAAEVGAAYDFDGRYAIQVEGQLPADLLREDGKTKVVVLPAAWLVLRLTVG